MIEIAVELTETVFIGERELEKMRARAKYLGYDDNLITEEKIKEVINDFGHYRANTIENFIECFVLELGEDENDITLDDMRIID